MGTAKEPSAPTTIHLTMSPMQWANLKDIDDVKPLNPDDYECLAEVREVLKKHNKRDRFGVALLHKHFDVEPDEVLMEVSDKENRVLMINVHKRDSEAKGVETIWKLMDGEMEAMTWCEQQCIYGAGGHDRQEKRITNS